MVAQIKMPSTATPDAWQPEIPIHAELWHVCATRGIGVSVVTRVFTFGVEKVWATATSEYSCAWPHRETAGSRVLPLLTLGADAQRR
jgi:hypothetical protein